MKFFSWPLDGASIEPLRVTPCAFLERRVDEDLHELAVRHHLPRHPPLGAERRDEGDDHDKSRIGHQPCHLGHPADVLDAVGVREPEVAVQPVPDIVAVEDVGVAALRVQLLLEEVRDRRLARARQAGEPEHCRALVLDERALQLVDVQRLPMNVVGPPKHVPDHAGTSRSVAEPVDQDECAGCTVLREGVEHDRRLGRQVAHADLVHFERLCGLVGQVVYIEPVPELRDRRGDGVVLRPQDVGPPGQDRLLVEPDDGPRELVGDFRLDRGEARTSPRETSSSSSSTTVTAWPAMAASRSPPCATMRLTRDRLPLFATITSSPARIDPDATVPAKPRKSGSGRLTYCTGSRKGLDASGSSTSTVSSRSTRVGPEYQPVLPERRGDVVPEPRRNGNGHDRGEPETSGQAGIFRSDALEDVPVEADQVDLVDGEDDVPDAEQRDDEGVAPRLGKDAAPRIDEHDREIRSRRAGRHVSRVLLVAGGVGDDEFAFRRRKEPVGDVDGDALLALGVEPVDEEGEIEIAAGGAMPPRIAFQRRQLILENLLRLEEQPPDQRRLAVVDRAAGEEAQQRFAVLRREQGFRAVQATRCFRRPACGAFQKYPSRFFFSMEPASSRSISRPCRSDVLAVSISPTMASSVSAFDSMAAVSG